MAAQDAPNAPFFGNGKGMSAAPFPPGYVPPPDFNPRTYVAFGVAGTASKQQGNVLGLDPAWKGKLVWAEKTAGLSYKEIHQKYANWAVTESRLRGLYRDHIRDKKDLKRVKSWDDGDVSLFSLAYIRLSKLPLHLGF